LPYSSTSAAAAAAALSGGPHVTRRGVAAPDDT